MRILDWSSLDEAAQREALARPGLVARPEVTRVAEEVIAAVRRRGEQAVREFTQRFDGASLRSFEVAREEFAAARAALTPEQTAALERALRNVRAFHRAQRLLPVSVETEPGVLCEQLIRPIASVALYVPAGSAPLPSAVIMLAVPAEIAGCPRRILCTPPMRDGGAHPAVLVAAELCGIETVYKVGGAQAIAALAYGTETIPRVEKIFGPGNAWVTATKRLVASDPAGAACDLTAGPSEVLVVADETARAPFVAADLLAQAEHDVLAQALLVTVNAELAKHVDALLTSGAARLPRRQILSESLESCRAILVRDLGQALEVANIYAPEHLILHTREPRQWLPEVRNAGAVFLGEWSPETLGDYCTGANHVLPTYGTARSASGLSVRDFVKTISVQELTLPGLRALSPTAVALAELEGLEGHAQAVTRRLELEGLRA